MAVLSNAELNKLKNIQLQLNQAQNQFIQICSKDNPSLQEFLQKLNTESKNEWKTLRQDVLNIHNKMKNIIIKSNSIDENTTFTSLKSELIELKDLIENFKVNSKNKLKSLKTNEKNLTEDLQSYEQMYETWAKPIEIIEEPTFTKRIILNKMECPEVQEFHKFLDENKGHTNGWTWEDNAMFLKIKSMHKTIDKVTEKLHQKFPDKSVEEIENHFKWHEKYLAMRDRQKIAIQKWKVQKQNAQIAASNVNDVVHKPSTNKKVKILQPVDAEETKAKLQAWKDEKRRREQQEINARDLNEQFYKQLEIMKYQKNSELKEKVEQWRRIKAAEKRAIEAKRREEELKTRAFKAMLANHFIREFQNQDIRYIKKMQACKISKNQTDKLPQTASKIVIPRDPNRLLKPTKNWISKVETNKEEKIINNMGFNNNLNLNTIQKLKAPDWRK